MNYMIANLSWCKEFSSPDDSHLNNIRERGTHTLGLDLFVFVEETIALPLQSALHFYYHKSQRKFPIKWTLRWHTLSHLAHHVSEQKKSRLGA